MRRRKCSIGKSGFRILKSHAKSENHRKRILPPRNPFSWRISIKKSKSGFHGFPLYRSIGKSKKGFVKLFSWTVVFVLLIISACARPLFLRTVYQFLCRISPPQKTPKEWESKSRYLSAEIRFRFHVRLLIRNPAFKIWIQISQSNPPFQSLSQLFQITYLVKFKWTFLKLNYWEPFASSERERQFLRRLLYVLYKTWI